MARAMPVLPLVGSTMMVSGLDQAAFLGGIDHGDADAVLDAVSRVVEFQLGDHSPAPSVSGCRRTSGVLPINSVTLFAIFMICS